MALRISAFSAGFFGLFAGDRVGFTELSRIARQRGPEFAVNLSQSLTQSPKGLLVRLVELSTRTHLRPGSEFARIRAAALTQIGGNERAVHIEVARVLHPQRPIRRKKPIAPYRPEIGGRRFIVAYSLNNPYYWMMYSQLHHSGFNVQYVSGFVEILDAISMAQNNGESPHVHIDHWLTRNQATLLVSTMHESSTLSVTAHDLEHNASRADFKTGMRLLLQRAAAVHLLTESSLQRLGVSAKSVQGRSFHVAHPAYFGKHAGGYQLPRDRIEARRTLGRPSREFAVGIVGRVSDRKNVELLVAAAAELSKKHETNIRSLHIYISGAFGTKFTERIIRDASALSNVTVVAEDLGDVAVGLHVSALDVAVVPYHGYLNSGWTLLALSAGLPVIASRESTASEVVPHEALIEFSEGDARSLARAITESTRQNASVARAAALARANEVHPDIIALRFAQEIAARVFAK